MTQTTRIKQLEDKSGNNGKIYIYRCGDDGRVNYDSVELMGMTAAEVEAYTGDATRIKVIRASEETNNDTDNQNKTT